MIIYNLGIRVGARKRQKNRNCPSGNGPYLHTVLVDHSLLPKPRDCGLP